MQNFIPDFEMRSRSAKFSMALRYGGRKSTSVMGAGCAARGTGLPRYDSMAAIMEGLPEPPNQPLYLTPFHCAGLCDEVIIMPPAASRSRTPKLKAGVGVTALASMDGNSGGSDNLSAGLRECFRSEARVVADAETTWRIFLGGAFAGVDVRGDGFGGSANVSEGEIIGDNAAPAVGSEFDDRLRHMDLLVRAKD